MDYRPVTHVALKTRDLRTAERYYRFLFGMAVAFREAELADGWSTMPDGFDWDDAERSGVKLGLSVLHRDGYVLALEADDRPRTGGLLSHIGLAVSEAEMARVRDILSPLQCELLTERADLLVFRDVYTVQWELATNYDDDPGRQSNGVRRGRWLDVQRSLIP